MSEEARAAALAARWWGSSSEDMGHFAEHYGYTPAQYRALEYRDYVRLRRHLTKG